MPNRRSRSASSPCPWLISSSASRWAASPSPATARARSPSRSPALAQQLGQPAGGVHVAGLGAYYLYGLIQVAALDQQVDQQREDGRVPGVGRRAQYLHGLVQVAAPSHQVDHPPR